MRSKTCGRRTLNSSSNNGRIRAGRPMVNHPHSLSSSSSSKDLLEAALHSAITTNLVNRTISSNSLQNHPPSLRDTKLCHLQTKTSRMRRKRTRNRKRTSSPNKAKRKRKVQVQAGNVILREMSRNVCRRSMQFRKPSSGNRRFCRGPTVAIIIQRTDKRALRTPSCP